MSSSASHIVTRPVRFSDTDAAGVAHFSRLLVFVEEAVHDFFQRQKIPVFDAATAWPIVSLQTDFKAACRFEDKLDVALSVDRVGTSSLTMVFAVQKSDGTPCFDGRVTLCHIDPSQSAASPIPEKTRNALLAPAV
ncbi:MAG: acyl-CoA thioesterase [bacterium]